ncbi:MAG: dephospho-CoA kinase [Clostridium sp.]
MIKFGLTGGIGTGKSTITKMLLDKGYKVIDADNVSRDVLVKYPEILNRIRRDFGEGFFDWRGEFRRKEFGNHIFRFPKQRVKYEEIIMPYILKEIDDEINDYKKCGEKIIFLDAPTLIENNLHEKMDYVILVTSSHNTQLQRIKLRDKLSNNEALNRINAQMPLERKKDFAQIIIDNDGSLLDTKKQIDDLTEFVQNL